MCENGQPNLLTHNKHIYTVKAELNILCLWAAKARLIPEKNQFSIHY